MSPEPPTKERELQAQLLGKENDIRRLNDRLASMCEQAAESGRMQSALQQEKDRVQNLQSEVQELQRQLVQQKDEANTQNLQANARMLELQSQMHTLRQRCDLCDRENLAKADEVAAARAQFSEHETRMNALRRQLENSVLQLQIAQTNEGDMKKQLEAERKLHLADAQAAEEIKQFTRKVYGILKEGAVMLEKVPPSLGAACPPMKFDSSSTSASRDGSYSQ